MSLPSTFDRNRLPKTTRRCAVEDRSLLPGESYWSILRWDEDEEQMVRIDISERAWKGSPDGILGCWKNRMPTQATRTLRLAPDEVLISLLKELDQDNSKGPLRYLLSLLILRRRLAREVEGIHADPSLIELELITDGSRCTVKKYELTTDQGQAMQNSLADLIYCEAE